MVTRKIVASKKHHSHFIKHYKQPSLGDKASDWLTTKAGSWTFIISFGIFMSVWVGANIYGWLIGKWDPYPFILLNLVLSTLAALQAPIILMSQNRSADRDRRRADYDYKVNRLAEREISLLQKDLKHLHRKVDKIHHHVARRSRK